LFIKQRTENMLFRPDTQNVIREIKILAEQARGYNE
jgi:hypothetical protein